MYKITKSFTFHAAHHLPLHEGLCKNVHGHSYTAEITIGASILKSRGPETGMVMDFDRLKSVWKEIEPLLDHRDLNESLPDNWVSIEVCVSKDPPPTAEIICRGIYDHFNRELIPEYLKVKVFETATSSVEFSYDD